MKIAVLMGGESAERDISLASGKAVVEALRAGGHEVGELCVDAPIVIAASALVAEADVIFSVLHGGAGEDGRMQSLLEMMEKPFVGSGSASCALTMDKIWTKHICNDLGIRTASWKDLSLDFAQDQIVESAEELGFPLVLKPVREGSAIGVHILQSVTELEEILPALLPFTYEWMLEEYIAGRELTVPVFLGEVMENVEIRPREGFYDYQNKYTEGNSDYLCPAPVDREVAKEMADVSLRLFRTLQMRDMARVDFRLDLKNHCYLLEVNSIPGMTAMSLFPMGVSARGIDFQSMCERLCMKALARHRKEQDAKE